MNSSIALIGAARKLLAGAPSDAEVRRAISTAYYALFHHLCASFSEIVIVPAGTEFGRATQQAYRYIDHGPAKTRCIESRSASRNFPPGIVQFATAFINLQEKRLEADYEPSVRFEPAIASNLINDAERAIAAHDAESVEHRRAFAIFTALRPKGRG